MNLMLGTGLFLLLMSFVYLLDIVRRKGERFEFFAAMFYGELGLMFVFGQIIQSEAVALAVIITFGISMLISAVFWWKYFRQYKRRTAG